MIKSEYTGLILAGGQSRRMGQDKALLPWQGQPFLQHLIQKITPLVQTCWIVGAKPAYASFGLPMLSDKLADKGPVGALATALPQLPTSYALVVTCDVPMLPSSLLVELMSTPLTNLVRLLQVGERVQPLIGCYQKAAAVHFEQALAAEQLKLWDLVQQMTPQIVHCPRYFVPSLANINTPTLWNQHMKAVEIELKYFGKLVEHTQRTTEPFTLKEACTVAQLREQLVTHYQGLADEEFQVAVNQTLVPADAILAAGDEVALLPPFAGG